MLLSCACFALAGCSSRSPADSEPFEIAWGGDVLLGDAAREALTIHGYEWAFERIQALLAADYVVVNVEGPITSVTEPYFPDQEFSYNAEPVAAQALAKVGVDAAGLSNNHALDRGPEELQGTTNLLRGADVEPFGAGLLAQAEQPHLVETPSGLVAILAFGDAWQYGAEASDTELGTVSMSVDTVSRGYDLAARASARWTIAFVHWGENYEGVTKSQRDAARLFADAGYDLVIGHHPHIAQEVEIVDGMPVLYSLGNLVFGTPGRFETDAQGYGLIARTTLTPDDRIAIKLACIATDNENVKFQPEPCTAAETRRLFSELGPEVEIDGEINVVDADS